MPPLLPSPLQLLTITAVTHPIHCTLRAPSHNAVLQGNWQVHRGGVALNGITLFLLGPVFGESRARSKLIGRGPDGLSIQTSCPPQSHLLTAASAASRTIQLTCKDSCGLSTDPSRVHESDEANESKVYDGRFRSMRCHDCALGRSDLRESISQASLTERFPAAILMLCFDVVICYVCKSTLALLLVLHSALAHRQEWKIGCL